MGHLMECVNVVLPAAGTGQRMNSHIQKQFATISNRPVISYTIEAFERISWVKTIFIVVSEDMKEKIEDTIENCGHKKVVVCIGKNTRHRSIKEGVLFAGNYTLGDTVLVIHDAVRPFVEEITLQDLVNAANSYGAAGLTRPLTSTVLSVTDSGFLDHSLDRSKYVASEMPQAFRYDVIRNAYDKCSDDDLEFGTECLHLAHRYSDVTPKLLPGPEGLWKITYKKDLYAAEGIIKDCVRCIHVVNNTDTDVATSQFLSVFQHYCNSKKTKVVHSKELNLSVLSKVSHDLSCHVIVCYCEKSLSFEEIRKFVEEVSRWLELGTNKRHTGSVVYVFDISHGQESISEECLSIPMHFRRLSQVESLQDKNVLVNAVVLSGHTSDILEKSAALVWDLIRQRSKLYSGQTFIY